MLHSLRSRPGRRIVAVTAAIAAVTAALAPSAAAGTKPGFIGSLTTNAAVASTVPADGDVNPYGVAVIPRTVGRLVAGEVLVSNFNDAPTSGSPGGQQGRGSTLVEISPSGHRSLFAQIPAAQVPGGVGLTTALTVLRSGWVIVGSLPTSDGTPETMSPGELIVLDSSGRVRETISGDGIDGPWDSTALDLGGVAELFVANVLPGITGGEPAVTQSGDVVRLVLDLAGPLPTVLLSTVIADGISVRTDPAALIVGPTGLALGLNGSLFVADAADSRIARIPDAIFRRSAVDAGAAVATVASGAPLNGPLGLALAPDGDLLAANGNDNNLVELSSTGTVVAVRDLDAADPPGGTLFGLAVSRTTKTVFYVNDDTNTLDALH